MNKADTLKSIIYGHSSDLVFLANDVPGFISSGVLFRVELSTAGGRGVISLVSSDSSQEIISGPTIEVTQAYLELVKSVSKKRRSTFNQFGKISIALVPFALIGFMALGAFVHHHVMQNEALKHQAQQSSEISHNLGNGIMYPPIGELQDLPGSDDQVMEILRQITQGLQPATDIPTASPIALPTLTPIPAKPGMLKVPDEVDYEAKTVPAAETIKPTSSFLPPYDPAAYEVGSIGNEDPKNEETSAVVQEDPVKPVADASSPVAVVNKPVAAETVKDSPVAPEISSPEVATAVSVKEDEAVPAKSLELTQEEANEVAQSLVKKGLSPSGALDVLQQLEALSQADLADITPEMLDGLPHEVAQLLIDQGLVDMDKRYGDAPYRIIRLPESIVAQYRGRDGIASIPEANTWAATGNKIKIPLPGGGDIRQPDDLLSFGLEP